MTERILPGENRVRDRGIVLAGIIFSRVQPWLAGGGALDILKGHAGFSLSLGYLCAELAYYTV